MKRIVYIFLLALLVLTAALFSFRLQIGAFLFTKALEQTGVEDIQLELAVLNSRKLIFSLATCTLPSGGGKLSLHNAGLSWDRSTLRKRQLNTIAIDTLNFTLPPKAAVQPRKKIPLQQLIKQIERVRQILPFRDLHINHLIINGQAGPLAGRELALALENKSSRLVGKLFLNTQNLNLTLDSPERNQWNLKLDETGQKGPFLLAQVQLQEDRLQAEIKTDLAKLNALKPFVNRPLPEMEGTLTGTLSLTAATKAKADLVLDVQQAAVAGVTAASMRLALHGRMEDAGTFLLEDDSTLTISDLHNKKVSFADLTIGLDGILENTAGHWQYSVAPKTRASAHGINSSALHIESVQLTPAMSGTLSGKKILLNLKPNWRAQITNMQTGPLSFAETSLKTEQDTEIILQGNDEYPWAIAASTWLWTPNTVIIQDLSLSPAPIHIDIGQLTGTGKHWQGTAGFTSQNLSLTTANNGLTLRELSAEISADEGRIKGTASCSAKTVPGTLATHFSHDLKEGKGKAIVNTRKEFTLSDTTPLSTFVRHWPLAWDLTGGRLQVKSSIHWQKKQPLQLFLQTELSEGKGRFKTVLFSGCATSQNLQILPTIQSRESGVITIDEVHTHTGITATNISSKIVMAPSPHGKIPEIVFENLSASLFGGTIHDELLTVDPQRPDMESTLLLDDIDLSQLVTIQQVKGLAVTGRVHGTLPFRIDTSGLQLNEGRLQSTPAGGTIRYTPPEGNGLKDSPLTGYALKALEEFHYNHLSATTRYTPDGELQVSLHLEGTSAKLATNRPVHLNINTEQNLLSLLQSLRYSKSLTDEIDKEVQQHYQKSAP